MPVATRRGPAPPPSPGAGTTRSWQRTRMPARSTPARTFSCGRYRPPPCARRARGQAPVRAGHAPAERVSTGWGRAVGDDRQQGGDGRRRRECAKAERSTRESAAFAPRARRLRRTPRDAPAFPVGSHPLHPGQTAALGGASRCGVPRQGDRGLSARGMCAVSAGTRRHARAPAVSKCFLAPPWTSVSPLRYIPSSLPAEKR